MVHISLSSQIRKNRAKEEILVFFFLNVAQECVHIKAGFVCILIEIVIDCAFGNRNEKK